MLACATQNLRGCEGDTDLGERQSLAEAQDLRPHEEVVVDGRPEEVGVLVDGAFRDVFLRRHRKGCNSVDGRP